MPEICQVEHKLYRGITDVARKIVNVAGHYEVYHKNLITNYLWEKYIESTEEIVARFKEEPRRINLDMFLLYRNEGEIEIFGTSADFDWPPRELKEILRPLTFVLLREKYPDVKFVD